MPRDAEIVKGKWVRIGNRVVAPLHVAMFPSDPQAFQTLFTRLRSKNIPWRYSLHIDGDGLRGMSMKSTMAALLAWVPASGNKLASDAIGALRNYQMEQGTCVKIRLSVATWVTDTGQGEDALEEKLRTRALHLANAVSGWGGAKMDDVSGDAFGGMVSSDVGVSRINFGTPAAAPLPDTLLFIPLHRPASPWREGALLLRTPDGKPFPYQPGSSVQPTWIDLGFAPPGSGKSVLSQQINWAICLAPGIKRLPLISIIDIGPSSTGLIKLLQDALPRHLRHLAASFRMRMTKEYAVNIFDTQLGFHLPTPLERAAQVNLLTLLTTPVGQDGPYDGMVDLCGRVIDLAYKNFAPTGKATKKYQDNVNADVDKAIESTGIVIDDNSTWWEVRDSLFEHGMVHEASLAQRYAVPLLSDLTGIARDKSVSDLYSIPKIATQESVLEGFQRMINSALQEYPVLAFPTMFDIGQARVISIDLDEVAKGGGAAAHRRTGLMYMLAQFVGTRNFFFSKDDILGDCGCSEKFLPFQRRRVAELMEDVRRVVFDEFHRTSGNANVRNQVVEYMREGRKWAIQVGLFTQSMSDFDDVMIEFATSIFILGGGADAVTTNKVAERFGLSATARNALMTGKVHAPRAGGATFLAVFVTKKGRVEQLLTNTIGPMQLWAFTTTKKDAVLRDKLTAHWDSRRARDVLARYYQDGSAITEIERLENEVREGGGTVDEEDDNNSAIERLAAQIIERVRVDSMNKATAEA